MFDVERSLSVISLHIILSIAKYERKTLLRSWFFRIFSVITLVLLSGVNFIFIIQGGGDTGWAIRNIPAGIPYFNFLILNIFQGIIAVFLASGFLEKDKKLDTTDVIYIRCMTNGDYIFGKIWGNLQAFLILNLAVMFMALIFNLISQSTPVNWESYFIYLFLMSVPTLVYITGLSFLLMSIIRNQAITFIILLGYIGVTLFMLQNKYYYIFDYIAFNIPMVISEIAGMGNIDRVLLHRGIYFLLGISFVFITVFRLKRLRQSRAMTILSLIFAIIFSMAGGYLGFTHIKKFKDDISLRKEAIALNNTYVKEKLPVTLSHTISLEHRGNNIEVVSVLILKNENEQSLRKLIFSLNHGLEVKSLKLNEQEKPFQRRHHLVILDQNIELLPGEKAKVEFKFSGNISETLCYLDISEEERQKKYGKIILNIDKRYGFVTPEYVLLTPEINWYPKIGVTYSPTDLNWDHPEFINFNLEVKTEPWLQAVSQGDISEVSEGHFSFRNHLPMTQISLAIGKYEKKSVMIDSREYGIWHIEGHDFFSDAFPEAKDTLVRLINERMSDFEHTYNLEYAFDRFFLVEIPAQFKTYERIYTDRQEFIQPEQVLIPEKGYLLMETDFKGLKKQLTSREKNMTKKDIELRILNDFIEAFRRVQNREFFLGLYPNPYFIFPMLYNFQYGIHSEKWPVANRVVEAYLKTQPLDILGAFIRNNDNIDEDEQANIALQESSFEEILTDQKQKKIIDNVMKLKSEMLFSMAQLKVADQGEFNEFVYQFLRENKYTNITFEQFDKRIREKFGFELIPVMDRWFKAKALPGYLFSPFEAVHVNTHDRKKTKVSFKVTNSSDTEGIIKLLVRLPGGNTDLKLVFLEPRQTKDISIMLNADPQDVMVNTMTSSLEGRTAGMQGDPRSLVAKPLAFPRREVEPLIPIGHRPVEPGEPVDEDAHLLRQEAALEMPLDLPWNTAG